MQWQSTGQISLTIGAAFLLGGCFTPNFEDAEPEKYAGYDCEQLNMLSESYRATPQDLLQDDDPSELERTNARHDSSLVFGQRAGDRPIDAKEDRDRRSIALARRQKGCF